MMKEAAANGHVATLEWLLDIGITWYAENICEAGKGGHLPVLQWAKKKLLQFPARGKLSSCALSGNLDLLRWVKANNFSLRDSFSWASANGHVHVMDWLLEQGESPQEERKQIYSQAGKGGHLAVFQWMSRKGFRATLEAVKAAARNGHVELVKWGWNELGNGDEKEGREIMLEGAKGRSLETMRWVFLQGTKITSFLYNVVLFSGKGACKPSKIFDFLETNGCPIEPHEEMWRYALREGDLETLDWLSLRDKLVPGLWRHVVSRLSLDSLRWLNSKGCPKDNREDLFLIADSVFIMEWLKSAGFQPRGGPIEIANPAHWGPWLEIKTMEWLVQEGYRATSLLGEVWVRWKRWQLLKSYFHVTWNWNDVIWRKLLLVQEMKDWVTEHWKAEHVQKWEEERQREQLLSFKYATKW
jgi:hypothetical protein